ncbi:riboflavin biosynthesis protein [Tribonema minus]|uniref:Riboflavin biosynthesis protein n=1 Tax=Tribonema minus TaxID=303371 RepID=A0A836CBN8_9STRA|nr:riboflavin biosynthesis protein [Tribonema minus]
MAANGGAASSRPLVTLKLAVDQQGAVDDRSEAPKRFTSSESLDAVHRLRRDAGAVVVGVETVVRDNPSLTVRRVPLLDGQQQPLRVVLDRNLRIPEADQCQLLSDGHPTAVLFTNTPGTFVKARAAELMLSVLGLPVMIDDIPTDTPEDGCPLLTVVRFLGQRGISHIMVEGGPCIARQFLSDQLVDRAIIVKAPVKFQQPVPSGIDHSVLRSAGLELLGTTQWGPDEVECWSKPGLEWPNGGVGNWP